MPFQKGNKIGNRFTVDNQPEENGRIKGIQNRSTIVRRLLAIETKSKNELTGKEQILTQEELITIARIKEAQKEGGSMAYKVLMDSGYGAVQQKVDVTTNGQDIGSPIVNVFNQAPPMARSENEIEDNGE